MKRGILFFLAICLALTLGCSGNGNGDDGKAIAAAPAPKTTVYAYDADGQYLGVLLGIDPDEIFIPSLGYSFRTASTLGDVGDKEDYYAWANLLFETPDCVGDRFVVRQSLIMKDYDGKYFVGVDGPYDIPDFCDGDIPKASNLESDGSGGYLCHTVDCPDGDFNLPDERKYYRATEILEEELPFTIPMTAPFKYIYE